MVDCLGPAVQGLWLLQCFDARYGTHGWPQMVSSVRFGSPDRGLGDRFSPPLNPRTTHGAPEQ